MAKGCASESLSRVTKITAPSQTGYALLTFNTSTENNCLKIVTFNLNENALLKDVDDNFHAFGISAMNDENGYQTGRPLWRQCAVTEGVLHLPCPFFIACCFIVSVSSLFVHDAHYDYVVM